MKSDYPYKECITCKTIGDCPHPDVEDNMLGTPMPPDICARPIEIMANTERARKNKKFHNLSLN